MTMQDEFDALLRQCLRMGMPPDWIKQKLRPQVPANEWPQVSAALDVVIGDAIARLTP